MAYPIVIRHIVHAPPSDENHNYRIIATPSASTAGATPSASTAGAPPSASTAGAAPRVLQHHCLCHCQRPRHRFAAAVRLHPYMHESQRTPTIHPRPQPHALAYGMVPRSRPRSSKLEGGQQGMHPNERSNQRPTERRGRRGAEAPTVPRPLPQSSRLWNGLGLVTTCVALALAALASTRASQVKSSQVKSRLDLTWASHASAAPSSSGCAHTHQH